jgi:hypothetical protein
LLPLLHAAYLPRERHFGRKVMVHILNNVQNGLCPEDCGYCSQSSDSDAATTSKTDSVRKTAGTAPNPAIPMRRSASIRSRATRKSSQRPNTPRSRARVAIAWCSRAAAQQSSAPANSRP